MKKLLSFLKLKENSNIREILVNGVSTFSFKIISLVLAYALLLLITNKFGASVFGRYSITITLAQLVVMLFTLGLPSAIVKLTSDTINFNSIPQNNYLTKSVLLTLLSGVITTIILYLSSEFLAVTVFKDVQLIYYFKLLSLFIIPLLFHELLSNFFRGKKDFKKYNLFTFIVPYILFFIAFFIIMKYVSREEITFLSYGIGITITFIIEFFLYSKINTHAKTNFPTQKLLKLSLPMLFSTALLFLLNWTDVFMLGSMKSSTEVGIYNAAFKIASLGFIIIIAINVVITPKISELYSQHKMEDLKKVIRQSTWLIIVLTIPIVFIIILFRKQILGLFGNEFLSGEMSLIIISLGILISAISGNVDQILNMTNSHKILRNITLFCFIINVILNYVLIPIYGINGAAVASLITTILLNVSCLYYIKKKLGFLTFI